jgi:heterotetrameric sarcosine oxidase gamma subunit
MLPQLPGSNAAASVVEQLADQPATGPDAMPALRHWSITAKQQIIATGCTERPLVFANNDRPGIMLAGGLRTYLNRYAVAPGDRVILYTTDDEAAATIADITAHGAIVEAVIDPRRLPSEVVAAAAERVGAEVVPGAVSRAVGSRRVEGVEVRAIDGSTRTFDCDLVAMSDGWCPAGPPSLQRPVPKSLRLADCLAVGLAAGLAAAAKSGFPDAMVDAPETDDDPAGAAEPWPRRAPLRGLPARNRFAGLAFTDFATDRVAAATPAFDSGRLGADGTDLTTFDAPDRDDDNGPPAPPPMPPNRRLPVTDVFNPGAPPIRFGRMPGPPGVTVALRRNVAVARLTARSGQGQALTTRVADRIGVVLPPPGRHLAMGHLNFASIQPAAWLVIADDEDGPLFAQQLADDLKAFAEITDATADISIIEVTGRRARELLALGLELDTHPSVFRPGHCAPAALARMMMTVSCRAAGTDYRLAFNSSDLSDFANWLAQSGAEFGLETTA